VAVFCNRWPPKAARCRRLDGARSIDPRACCYTSRDAWTRLAALHAMGSKAACRERCKAAPSNGQRRPPDEEPAPAQSQVAAVGSSSDTGTETADDCQGPP